MKTHTYSKIFILITLFINFNVYSQLPRFEYNVGHTTLDSANIEITYKLEWVNDLKNSEKKNIDILKLYTGGRISKSFSYLISRNDSICAILEAKHSEKLPSEPSEATTEEVFKYFKSNELVVMNRIDNTIYKYNEELPKFKWIIQPEKVIIQKYHCQKAITKFRGREYEAWFTSEIPLSDGPWKFYGLPGLILRVYDSDKQYIFNCAGIKKTKTSIPVKTCKREHVLTTREKLAELLAKKYKNVTSYYNIMGVTYGTKINGKYVFDPPNYSLPYNPIELE